MKTKIRANERGKKGDIDFLSTALLQSFSLPCGFPPVINLFCCPRRREKKRKGKKKMHPDVSPPFSLSFSSPQLPKRTRHISQLSLSLSPVRSHLVGVTLKLAELDALFQLDPPDGAQILDVDLALLDVLQQDLHPGLPIVLAVGHQGDAGALEVLWGGGGGKKERGEKEKRRKSSSLPSSVLTRRRSNLV